MISIILISIGTLGILLLVAKHVYLAFKEYDGAKKTQEDRNIKFIKTLLHGNHKALKESEIDEILDRFSAWKHKERELFEKSSYKTDIYTYNRNNVDISDICFGDDPPMEESLMVLLYSHVFTDPFPSVHDMDDWAIDTKLQDILFLLGYINKKGLEMPRLYLHKTAHYVNHGMVQGIIVFDLYIEEGWQ